MEIKYKIVLIGDTNVGKTSLVQRLHTHHFSGITDSTIGGAFSSKKINIDDKNIILNIWDTAGQERYKSIAKFFYRGAIGCLCVFDLTDKSSFESLKKIWINMFDECNQDHEYYILIVGNKSDLDKSMWQVSENQIMLFVDDCRTNFKCKCDYILTSCCNGENVFNAFYNIASNIIYLPTNMSDKMMEIMEIDNTQNNSICQC